MKTTTVIGRRGLPFSRIGPFPGLGALLGSAMLLALTACASTSQVNHSAMRGQVLSLDNDELVICIGERDGAQAGQILQLVRHVPQRMPKARSGFRRESIGQVRIIEVFDEHYANAAVLKGQPRVADVVELARPEQRAAARATEAVPPRTHH
jgi:hypothetical protein